MSPAGSGGQWWLFKPIIIGSRSVLSAALQATFFLDALTLQLGRLKLSKDGLEVFSKSKEQLSSLQRRTMASGYGAVATYLQRTRSCSLVTLSSKSQAEGSLPYLLSTAVLVPLFNESPEGPPLPSSEDAGGGLDEILNSGGDNGSDGEQGIEDLSLACTSVTNGVQNGVVKEPKTGVSFPASLCIDGDDGSCNVLAGVGVRSRDIVKVKTIKVYAFGLYVKPGNVQRLLGSKYRGIPPEELKFHPQFYEDLLANEFDMTVRLVVHYRGLSMEMVRNAFRTSLTNRLAKIGGSPADGLDDFTSYFSADKKIDRGTTIDFRWQPGGVFVTAIDGKQVGSFVSPRLCHAFFDLYIGEPPVSKRAKQEIGESFARMLNGCA